MTLDGELVASDTSKLCVLCHSIGCWLWLHRAARRTGQTVARVLLVAPPAPEWAIAELARFPEPPLDIEGVRRAGTTRLVFSRDDSYCPGGADRAFTSLGLEADEVPAGRHLNSDAGYGSSPAALGWCLDETVPLTANDNGAQSRP